MKKQRRCGALVSLSVLMLLPSSSNSFQRNNYRHHGVLPISRSSLDPLNSGGDTSDDEGNNSPLSDLEFPQGRALDRLRAHLEASRESLQWARAWKNKDQIDLLQRRIDFLESKDPELVYEKAHFFLERLQELDISMEQTELVDFWLDRAQKSRAALPRFQMEGLWLGKYGEDAREQLVNVTYVGDTLVATKVTGDSRVPRGQTSFEVNLAPASRSSPDYLPPIRFGTTRSTSSTEDMAASSSSSATSTTSTGPTLFRYAGMGLVAEENFSKARHVPGQMVIFGSYFSFIWLPTKHNVFFVKPSDDDVLRLMRNDISREDELENQKEHLERCFAMDLDAHIAQHPVFELEQPSNYSLLPRPSVVNHRDIEKLPRQNFRRIMTQEEIEASEEKPKLATRVLAAIPNTLKKCVSRFLGSTQDNIMDCFL